MPELKHVSASQVATFAKCKRKWHWEKISGFVSPGTKSQDLGKSIHAAIERWIKTGLNDTEHAKIVTAVIEYITREAVSEHEISLDTVPGGPRWIGFVDYEHLKLILDFKTTSDLRYAKTPEELLEDIQMSAYARAWFEKNPSEQVCTIAQLFIGTKTKTPKTKYVSVDITREQVAKNTERDLALVAEMIQLANVPDSMSIEPNPEHCSAYGGCYHKNRCGISVVDDLYSIGKKTGGNMGFFDSFKEEANNMPKASKGFTGVVPPDAPQAAVPTEPKPAPVATVVPYTAGMTLYLDCMPCKGDIEYLIFEDWFMPILSMLQQFANENEKEDYRMLQYSQEKAAIGRATLQYIKEHGLPKAIVVSTGNMITRDVLPCLIPFARTVVRGMRG
jgi:CRISPR/Cas system-associated exonuclease Cas4 (RecB family)